MEAVRCTVYAVMCVECTYFGEFLGREQHLQSDHGEGEVIPTWEVVAPLDESQSWVSVRMIIDVGQLALGIVKMDAVVVPSKLHGTIILGEEDVVGAEGPVDYSVSPVQQGDLLHYLPQHLNTVLFDQLFLRQYVGQ